MSSFWTLGAGAKDRQLIGNDFTPGEGDRVVWRDAAGGREPARAPILDSTHNGSIVSPGFGGRFYYMALGRATVAELTPVAGSKVEPGEESPAQKGSKYRKPHRRDHLPREPRTSLRTAETSGCASTAETSGCASTAETSGCARRLRGSSPSRRSLCCSAALKMKLWRQASSDYFLPFFFFLSFFLSFFLAFFRSAFFRDFFSFLTAFFFSAFFLAFFFAPM